MSGMRLVSYGLDIGKKSFAWCRIDQNGKILDFSSRQYKAQGKLAKLEEALSHDLDDLNNNQIDAVAIGVDAPMWFVERFEPRFSQENSNYQWYNRSGAAAAAMSWVYLPKILCLIATKKCIATLNPPTTSGSIVYLYEGFMAGSYKISKNKNNNNNNNQSLKGIKRDMVDAFAVAAAFWITFTNKQPQNTAYPYNSRTLPTPKKISPSYTGTCYSIWHAMGHAVGVQVQGGPQCDVFYY